MQNLEPFPLPPRAVPGSPLAPSWYTCGQRAALPQLLSPAPRAASCSVRCLWAAAGVQPGTFSSHRFLLGVASVIWIVLGGMQPSTPWGCPRQFTLRRAAGSGPARRLAPGPGSTRRLRPLAHLLWLQPGWLPGTPWAPPELREGKRSHPVPLSGCASWSAAEVWLLTSWFLLGTPLLPWSQGHATQLSALWL